jgi:hypothetical protein
MTKTTGNKKILIAFIDKKHEYFPEACEKFSSGMISEKSLYDYFYIISNFIDDLRLDQKESLKRSNQNIQEKVKSLKNNIGLRESALKDDYFIVHHKISEDELNKEINIYKILLKYWNSRRATPYKYWGIETWFYFYFQWMDEYTFDSYYQRSLLLDLMGLCEYHKIEYMDHERLLKVKKELMKIKAIGETELAFINQTGKKYKNQKEKKQLIQLYKRK